MPCPRERLPACGLLAAIALLTAGLAACLAACAAPGPQATGDADARETAPAYEVREYELEGGVVHVSLKIPQQPPGRKAAVIQPIADEQALLSRGITVVRFHHDWRAALDRMGEKPQPAPDPAANVVGRWLLAAPSPGLVGSNFFAAIHASAASSVPRVVDLLVSLPEVDPERIGIAGSSTDGFVALEALMAEPRLAAAVVRVACGDYHTFLRASTLALADDPRWLPAGELRLDPGYEARLSAQEPIRHADAFPPRPLLMLNGTGDQAVPYACAKRTARVLHAAYARAGQADRFRAVAYEGAGHDVGAASDEETLRWWERWLLPAQTAASTAGR